MPDPVEDVVPGEETPAEEKHDGFISDKQHAERVGVQHKKFRYEEQARIKAEERATATEKELDELKAKQAEVIVPPVPNQDSETFAADIETRDAAIRKQADLKAEVQRKADEREKEDKAKETEENAALTKRVAEFDSNLVSHGLNPAQVKVAAESVINYGISQTFQDILLDDKDGPLFVQYLAANPVEAEAMNGMPTLELVNHLNGEIRAKALLLKPQTSNAPNPPIVPDGGGAPDSKEDWEKGAVYE